MRDNRAVGAEPPRTAAVLHCSLVGCGAGMGNSLTLTTFLPAVLETNNTVENWFEAVVLDSSASISPGGQSNLCTGAKPLVDNRNCHTGDGDTIDQARPLSTTQTDIATETEFAFDEEHTDYESAEELSQSSEADTSKIKCEHDEDLQEKIYELNKKNHYLSTNLIETNSHLLGIYKKIKILENHLEELADVKKENSFLYKKFLSVGKENSELREQVFAMEERQKVVVEQLQLVRERLGPLNCLSDSGLGLSLESLTSEVSMRSAPCMADNPPTSASLDPECGPPRPGLQVLLLRCLLPSVVTVAAVVVNMYLYLLSYNNKFPI